MDDIGLNLARRSGSVVPTIGRGLVQGMPALLSAIAAVGVVAMLWVGGHIIVAGLDDLGWHDPYDLVHHLQHAVEDGVSFASAALGWLTNTALSAVAGAVVGAVVVAVAHLVRRQPESPISR
jgi:predicted DNA repair protein MutK